MIKLLVKQRKKNRQIALVEDDELLLFNIDFFNNKHNKGNVYCAFISSMPSSLQGLFITYDNGKEGFISFKAIHPSYFQNISDQDKTSIINNMKNSFQNKNYYDNIQIHKHLYIGQKLLVQMIRLCDDFKNPMFSTFISIGEKLSYIPNSITSSFFIDKSLSISFKHKIKKHIKQLPDNIGSFSIKKEITTEEVDNVIQVWQNLKKEFEMCDGVKLLLCVNNFFKTIFIQTEKIDQIIIHNEDVSPENCCKNNLLTFWPNASYSYSSNIFCHIREQIKEIFNYKNQLPSGGYILWSVLSSGTMIDVNIGSHDSSEDYDQTVLRVNFEAVQIITKQIKLRNIGGLIIIDFLKMSDNIHKNIINEYMQTLLKEDLGNVCFEPINSLGVMNISRQYNCGISLKQMLIINEDFQIRPEIEINSI